MANALAYDGTAGFGGAFISYQSADGKPIGQFMEELGDAMMALGEALLAGRWTRPRTHGQAADAVSRSARRVSTMSTIMPSWPPTSPRPRPPNDGRAAAQHEYISWREVPEFTANRRWATWPATATATAVWEDL
ncbi:hypothetical protein ACWD33_18515 [Streptomyces xiamenensis]|uniref:hypothetical protein n=1 Tax=Streptomyces xiamenensis TaxID=408015 RepID=UPI0035DFEC1C